MSRHQEFMFIAEAMSGKSPDPSTKVGSIIVDKDNIIAFGYNHIPHRIAFTQAQINDREWKYPRVIHAEVDAILKMGRQIVSYPILYSTHYPCAACATLMVEAGIKELYTKKVPPDMAFRWADSMKLAGQILQEGGVFVNFLDGP